MMSGEDVAGIKQELAEFRGMVLTKLDNLKETLEEVATGKTAHCATQGARVASLEHRVKHLEAQAEESNRDAKGNWQWSWRLVVGVIVTVVLSSVTTAIIGTVIAKAVFKQ